MITAAQRITRRMSLGGSDARLVMQGEWLRLYQSKVGPDDYEPSLKFDVCAITEPVNLHWFGKLNSVEVQLEPEMLRHEEHPHLHMNVDGWFTDPKGKKALIEAVHFSAWSKAEEAIAHKFAQCQHGMLFGFDYAVISALYDNGSKLEPYVIERDPSWQAEYLDRARSFWWHVENKKPPVDPHAAKKKSVAVKILGTATYDMADHKSANSWANEADRFLQNREAAAVCDEAKAALKKLVPADAKIAHGFGVRIVRDGRGLNVGVEE